MKIAQGMVTIFTDSEDEGNLLLEILFRMGTCFTVNAFGKGYLFLCASLTLEQFTHVQSIGSPGFDKSCWKAYNNGTGDVPTLHSLGIINAQSIRQELGLVTSDPVEKGSG